VTPFVGEIHVHQLVFIKFNEPLFSSVAYCCNVSVASSKSAPTAMMAVSSAKVATVVPSG
jgi:hypothetical protein